jgi:hypothetical protein
MKKFVRSSTVVIMLIVSLVASCSLMPLTNRLESLEINATLEYLDIGEQFTIEPDISPSRVALQDVELRYTVTSAYGEGSEFAEVLQLSDNRAIITALAPGEINLLVEEVRNIGLGVSDSAVIRISSDFVGTKYIDSSYGFYRLGVGETKLVTADFSHNPIVENQRITWTTSDRNVLDIVGSGGDVLFTAEGPGVALVSINHPDSINTFQIEVVVEPDVVSIEIDPDSLVMANGQLRRVSARHDSPNYDLNDVSWGIVSGLDVININPNGYICDITATQAGSATLRASLPNGSYQLMSVLVTNNDYFQFLTLIPELEPGQTLDILYEYTGSAMEPSFTTSDPTVLRVVNWDHGAGVVTVEGLSLGDAHLIATSPGMTQKLTVQVTYPYVFILPGLSTEVTIAQEYPLEYEVYPESSVTWRILNAESGDGSVNVGNEIIGDSFEQLNILMMKPGVYNLEGTQIGSGIQQNLSVIVDAAQPVIPRPTLQVAGRDNTSAYDYENYAVAVQNDGHTPESVPSGYSGDLYLLNWSTYKLVFSDETPGDMTDLSIGWNWNPNTGITNLNNLGLKSVPWYTRNGGYHEVNLATNDFKKAFLKPSNRWVGDLTLTFSNETGSVVYRYRIWTYI